MRRILILPYVSTTILPRYDDPCRYENSRDTILINPMDIWCDMDSS